jgi:hypothetical protein
LKPALPCIASNAVENNTPASRPSPAGSQVPPGSPTVYCAASPAMQLTTTRMPALPHLQTLKSRQAGQRCICAAVDVQRPHNAAHSRQRRQIRNGSIVDDGQAATHCGEGPDACCWTCERDELHFCWIDAELDVPVVSTCDCGAPVGGDLCSSMQDTGSIVSACSPESKPSWHGAYYETFMFQAGLHSTSCGMRHTALKSGCLYSSGQTL